MSEQLPSFPRLGSAPREYDQTFMNRLVSVIDGILRRQANPGSIYGGSLNLNNLPTSASGLRSGDVWVDPSDSYRLKQVP